MPIITRRFPHLIQPQYPAQLKGEYKQGLVGLWPLSSAVPSQDIAGGQPDASVVGPVLRPAPWGTGYWFDGSNDYIQLNDPAYSDAFRFIITVRPETVDANLRTIAHKRNTTGTTSGSNEWVLYLTTGGFTYVSWSSGSTQTVSITSNFVPVVGQTYDIEIRQAGAGLICEMWVNGVLVGSATQAVAMQNTTSVIQLGVYQGGTAGRWFKGTLSNFGVWNG